MLGLVIPRRKHLRIGKRKRRGVLPIGRAAVFSLSSLPRRVGRGGIPWGWDARPINEFLRSALQNRGMREACRTRQHRSLNTPISATRPLKYKYTHRKNLTSKLGKSGGLLRCKKHWLIVGKNGPWGCRRKQWPLVQVFVGVLS